MVGHQLGAHSLTYQRAVERHVVGVQRVLARLLLAQIPAMQLHGQRLPCSTHHHVPV